MGRTSDVLTSVKIFEIFFRPISTFLVTFYMFSGSRNLNLMSKLTKNENWKNFVCIYKTSLETNHLP